MGMKTRNVQADLIRVISCILVIAVHTRGELIGKYPDVEYWLKPLVIVCNPLFFMLSGRFALRPFSDSRQGFKDYYIKKAVSILIPYFLICMLLFFWNNEFTSFDFIQFLTAFFSTKVSFQLWFMRPMIGLLISAPFLSILVNNLSGSGKKTLILIGLIWNFLSIIVFTNILHISWGFSLWLLETWTLYFVLGYFIDLVEDFKKIHFIILGGLLCYIITVLQKMYLPQDSLSGIEDISPIFTCFAVAIYLLLDRFAIIKSERIGKALGFISGRTFFIFLIHVNVINELEKHNIFIIKNVWVNYFVKTFIVFIVSIFLAWILDIAYRAIKVGFLYFGHGIRHCYCSFKK